MKRLELLLSKIETAMSHHEKISLPVSKSSVGWHVEHTLLTINAIIDDLQKSEPKNYKHTYNLRKFLIFTIKKIPRGRAKAPNVIIPQQFDNETVKIHLEKTKINVEKLNTINAESYFRHPFLGHIKLKPAIKFLGIHTTHHLKIINDIIRN